MGQKRSLEEAKKLFLDSGVTPLFSEYTSANKPLGYRCSCGREDSMSISSLFRSLKNFPTLKCKRCRLNDLEKFRAQDNESRIRNQFPEVEILDIIPGKYGVHPIKIIYICPICGDKSSIYYKKHLSSLICKKCSRKSIIEKQRLDQLEVKSLFEVHNAILYSEYKHTNQKLIFRCECGNIGGIMLTNLKYKGVKPLCKQCQLKYSYLRGENSPSWNPNLTEESRSNWGRSSEDKQWYNQIFEQFNYTCFVSGRRNIPLSAHHLNPYSRYPELRLDLDNGICISRELHLKFHREYSYINMTIEDFCEFFRKETGEDFKFYYDTNNKLWREKKMSSLQEKGKRVRHSTESIKRDFLKYGAEPLFEEYKNIREELGYRCFCGNISFTTCEQFYMHIRKYPRYKLMCQSCTCKEALNNKRDNFFEHTIKPYFLERGVRLLSETYENNHTPLRFICSCGKESLVTWISLKNNNCLKCKDCQASDKSKRVEQDSIRHIASKVEDNAITQFKDFCEEYKNISSLEKGTIIEFIEGTPHPSYLLNKKKEYSDQGRNYIPFFAPEIRMKHDIVLSMSRYKWRDIQNKIFARKLRIVEVKDFQKVSRFLDENHIQGSTVSSINLALMNGDDMVSLMTFNKESKKGDKEFSLQRFCSKINTIVVGGASKLFKYFVKEYDPLKITTYGDVRFSELVPQNSIYFRLGFKYSHTSKPNYWYTSDGLNMIFRRKFQRKYLPKIFKKEYDSTLSERDIMLAEGYQRLYDCGNHVFIYEKN